MKDILGSLLLTYFFVLSTLSTDTYADGTFEDGAYAIAAFRDGCLNQSPDYSDTYDTFKKYGFSVSTSDELMLEWVGIGYAGFGYAGKEGSKAEKYKSCIVYLKGVPFIKVATTVNFLLKEKHGSIKHKQIGKDLYWNLPKTEGINQLVTVSEKNNGNYEGYIMMMLTELEH